MVESKTTLEIIIDSAEFAKEFNYFLTIQIDGEGEKRRTDVSAPSKKPIFTNNKFYLPLKNYDLIINQRLSLNAFVVIERPENQGKDGLGQAKLLGECILELGPLTADLTNLNGTAVRVDVNLLRKLTDENAIVGKLNMSLKLLSESIVPDDDLFRQVGNDNDQVLPEMDMTVSFNWRIRVDLRSGIFLPFNRTSENRLPSCFIECAWIRNHLQEINLSEAARSVIVEGNRFPIWNHQLLYYPPPEDIKMNDGFFLILLKDKYTIKPIQRIVIPMNCLKSFHPVHLDFLLDLKEEDNANNRAHLFLSLTLEESHELKISEGLVNIIVNQISFDPNPTSTNRCSVIMTTENSLPDEIPYKEIELKSNSHLSQVLTNHNNEPFKVFMTNSLKIPTKSLQNQYNAIANFIVPRSFLEYKLSFFLAVRDVKVISTHSMPNSIIGNILTSDDMLKTSFFSKNHEIVPFKTSWKKDTLIYPNIAHSRCIVEMSLRPVEKIGEIKPVKSDVIDYDKIKDNIIKSQFDLSKVSDVEKWDILSKELHQKQELINRMIKEVDEKSESLKLTAVEIIDLRKQVKMLQSENAILRKNVGREEQIQIESLITREIQSMSLPEMKTKIIKLANAYRAERMRNEEFEKALKSAHNEISNSRKLANDFENLQKVHEEESKKFLELQVETQKISIFKETVKKQEEVIMKLEEVLNKTMLENKRNKESLFELELLRTENMKLQRELKDYVVNSKPGSLNNKNSELDQIKRENENMKEIVRTLQRELSEKRPVSAEKRDLINEKLDLEVKLHKANSRIESLENEHNNNMKKMAYEIARLRGEITEKNSIIDSLRMEMLA